MFARGLFCFFLIVFTWGVFLLFYFIIQWWMFDLVAVWSSFARGGGGVGGIALRALLLTIGDIPPSSGRVVSALQRPFLLPRFALCPEDVALSPFALSVLVALHVGS